MAVYADKPFTLIPDPRRMLGEGEKYDVFDDMASEMACVHNVFIRSINAIYLQAPNVLRKDAHSFCRYAYVWYRLIHLHHTGEEEGFFPAVEELVGEPVMRVNVSQHEAFHKGLEIFGAYLSDCIDEPIMFNGYHLATLIDNFAPTLVSHLEDEIVTLSQLRRFGEEKLPGIAEIMTREGKASLAKAGLFSGLPFVFANIDYAFEDGRWSWPPVPAWMVLLNRYIFRLVHPTWWKFAACDCYGQMQPLYAVPETVVARGG